MKKAIISVFGRDRVGIIARVCTYLSENNVNIEDITQNIMQGYFNMMMITEVSSCPKSVSELSKELSAIGEEMGLDIRCQNEEIFNMMHRV